MKMKRKPLEAYVCFVLLAVMTSCMTLEVTSRYLFGSSFVWAEELTRYLFIWFIFISASYAVIERAHIKADSFIAIFPLRIRPYISLVGTLIWIAFSLFVTYQGIIYALTLIDAGSKSPALGISTGIVYMGIPIGYFLMSLRLIVQVIGDFRTARVKELDPQEITGDNKMII